MATILKKVIFDDFPFDLPIVAIFGAVKGIFTIEITPEPPVGRLFQKKWEIPMFSEIGLKSQLKRSINEKTAIYDI